MIDSECQNQPCDCQRFRAGDLDDKCLFCGHSIGFHKFEDVDTSEHPFGNCKQCFCQRFKKGHLDPLRCHYCSDYEGFHVSWPTINLSSNAITKPQQPQQPTSPTAGNKKRGRPPADKLKISYLICFDKVTPNKIPRYENAAWSNLDSKKLIKNDVEISSKVDIYNEIRNLFGGRLDDQTFRLYDASSSKPVPTDKEFSFNSIKESLTITNKKLYIGPSEHDIDFESRAINTSFENGIIGGIPVDNYGNESVPFHATGSNTSFENGIMGGIPPVDNLNYGNGSVPFHATTSFENSIIGGTLGYYGYLAYNNN